MFFSVNYERKTTLQQQHNQINKMANNTLNASMFKRKRYEEVLSSPSSSLEEVWLRSKQAEQEQICRRRQRNKCNDALNASPL
jgi:hypothetical protein